MLVAVIADTHWGYGGNSGTFHDSQKRFVDGVLLPTMRERDIRSVVHLGDLMDQKKYVNYVTARRLYDDFVAPLRDIGAFVDVLVGNHDVYYRDSNDQNSVRTLLRDTAGFSVVEGPKDTSLGKLDVLYLPWICRANAERSAELIRTSKAQWVMGHLEIASFGMYRGVFNQSGISPSAFGRFERVLSGHFHHRSERGNITYVGSTCQYNWNDHGDVRGFHVLDTEARTLEFVPNPEQTFVKLFYDDADGPPAVDTAGLEGKHVRLVVRSMRDPAAHDRVVGAIEESGAGRLQVVADHRRAGEVPESEIAADAGDTMSILMRHVDAAVAAEPPYHVDGATLRALVTELYNEASSAE